MHQGAEFQGYTCRGSVKFLTRNKMHDSTTEFMGRWSGFGKVSVQWPQILYNM